MHEPTLYIHYAPVWSCMNKDSFVIVLFENYMFNENKLSVGARDFLEKIAKDGYKIINLTDILRRGVKYRYVVSNHIIWGTSIDRDKLENRRKKIKENRKKKIFNFFNMLIGDKTRYEENYIDSIQYLPLQIGIKQIRFMYGADISPGWSLQPWNEMYDLFLCHGPNDAEILGQQFSGKTIIMGYPRYDGYFSQDYDTADVVEEFGIDSSKKTILWMPTTGAGVCSIPDFAEKISLLNGKFNVIVRPHPISFRADPEYIELLHALNFKIDSNSARDMNKLLKIVDLLLCDYGGSAFAAIYLDKNMVLLEPNGMKDSSMAAGSSNLELKKHFPVIHHDDTEKILRLIDDKEFWRKNKERRRTLFEKYFANNRGKSAQCVAEILSNLDEILKK